MRDQRGPSHLHTPATVLDAPTSVPVLLVEHQGMNREQRRHGVPVTVPTEHGLQTHLLMRPGLAGGWRARPVINVPVLLEKPRRGRRVRRGRVSA